MIEKKMMTSSSPETSTNDANATSAFPKWKLYDNPFYSAQPQHQSQHCLHIMEMKTELEHERKTRRKLEAINKKLSKELHEERRAREAIEFVCEELAREVSCRNSEMNKMRKEMEEERRMLRVAELIREERVQMKLSEAKFLFEEKVFKLSCGKLVQTEKPTSCVENDDPVWSNVVSRTNSKRENCGGVSTVMMNQRRVSPESENPHIKRGIKGNVEFPRVVRAIGIRSRHWGTKLECQKAQLRILLKQKSPNSLIISHGYRGGGNYSPRHRDEGSLSRIQEDSLSTDFSSVGMEYGNHQPYKQGQNTTLPYPSYYLPYGMHSSNSSWSNSDVGSQGPIHDPYGWHVSQYMQNFMGEQTFDEYYNYNSTLATENDEENSRNFEPHRRSTWF